MPHITIEYTTNLEDKIAIDGLIEKVHAAVAATNVAELAGFRTRAEPRDHYRVADNDPRAGFIAITIRVARGRPQEVIKSVLDAAAGATRRHLGSVLDTTPIALSVEVQEIIPEMRINENNIRKFMKRENAA